MQFRRDAHHEFAAKAFAGKRFWRGLAVCFHVLDCIRNNLAGSEVPTDAVCFQAQQAAEKAVKAWLQAQDDPFPKTQDIEELVEQAAKSDPGFQPLTKPAAVLTPYVSAFRYPGGADDPMPSREEFDEALKHASVIYDFVLNLLPAEARP